MNINRNDALYRATTTTSTTTTTIAPPPTTERQRPLRRKPPLRRRRPQNDYYYEDEEYEDDYVEERVNRRRKPSTRNRNRPVYEDDYPEKEKVYDDDEEPLDDDYDYRTQSRNRNRPGNNRRYRNRERNTRRNLNEQRSTTRAQDDEPRQAEAPRRYNRDRRPVQDERDRVRDRDRNSYVTNNSKRPLRNEDEEELDIEYEKPRSNYDEAEEGLPRRNNFRNSQPEKHDAEEELPRRNNFRNTQQEKRLKGRTNPPVNRDDFEDSPLPSRRKNNREETREEELPKVRSSSNGASVFNRPRIPPKISRPVPLNEKQKYDYKKNENPSVPSSSANDKEDYYDEYEDEQPPPPKAQAKSEVKPQAQHQSKTIVAAPARNSRPSVKEDIPKEEFIEEEYDDTVESDDYDRSRQDARPISKLESYQSKSTGPGQDSSVQARRNTNDNNDRSSSPSTLQSDQQKIREKFRNNFRSQSRQPIEDTPKEPAPVVDDRGRNNQKQNNNDQQNVRNKFRNSYRPNVKEVKSSVIQTPTAADEDIESIPKDVSPKQSIYLPYKPPNSRFPPTAKDISPQIDIEPPLFDETPKREQNQKNQQSPPSAVDSLNDNVEVRHAVRVVKRPFLPSRGGNPYLPRGLRPVGSSEEDSYNIASSKEQQNENVRQPQEPIQQQQPVRNTNYDQRHHFPGPLTTQPPQVDPPKDALDQIYSEYDVTLNDALNPTLKPLVSSRGSPIGFSLNNKYDQQQYSYVPLNTATAQSRSSVIQVPYDDKKYKTYVDEYEY